MECSKNAQRIENAKPQLSDIVKAYKISSKIYFVFSADMPKDEKEFWENACLNTRILLDRLLDKAILLYEQIKDAQNPEKKAKYDKLQISLHNETYVRGLLT